MATQKKKINGSQNKMMIILYISCVYHNQTLSLFWKVLVYNHLWTIYNFENGIIFNMKVYCQSIYNILMTFVNHLRVW